MPNGPRRRYLIRVGTILLLGVPLLWLCLSLLAAVTRGCSPHF